MQHDEFTHGHKCYASIGGVRHLVALRPTIQPYPGETASDFETRMWRLDALMQRDPKVISVRLNFLYAGATVIKHCELDIELIPEPQVAELSYVSTRRSVRGSRGSGRGNTAPIPV